MSLLLRSCRPAARAFAPRGVRYGVRTLAAVPKNEGQGIAGGKNGHRRRQECTPPGTAGGQPVYEIPLPMYPF